MRCKRTGSRRRRRGRRRRRTSEGWRERLVLRSLQNLQRM
jgi:hypothetical protein